MQPSDEIYAILQHQLMVSGKDKIKYLSYWKGQVCIAADIDRNDKFIETLIQSEKDFLKKL
jgi:predicted phage-related endonuclease